MWLKIFKYDKEAKTPARNLPLDAGVDLVANKDVFIPVGRTENIPVDVAFNIPPGYVGLIMDRSSMALKGLKIGGGVVDSGFSGPLSVILHNLNNMSATLAEDPVVTPETWELPIIFGYDVKKGDRIAQMLIIKCELYPVQEVETLWTSDRGSKGLGSSGK